MGALPEAGALLRYERGSLSVGRKHQPDYRTRAAESAEQLDGATAGGAAEVDAAKAGEGVSGGNCGGVITRN